MIQKRMQKRIWSRATLLLCAVAMLLLPGCWADLAIGVNGVLTAETYPDAEKYQVGPVTYRAEAVKAIEVYWRSGEVEITESDDAELSCEESGSALPEDAAMHYLLEDGVLRIRFCASGATLRVNASKKHLRLAVPQGIDLSVHATSAAVKAGDLNQNSVLIAAFSGDTELGAVTAARVDLSSSSGSIQARSVSAKSLACAASSGEVAIEAAAVQSLDCNTSSGAITVGSMSAETAQIATRSGSVHLTLAEVPSAEIQTSSGKVDLTLAPGGAEVLRTAASGRLITDRAYERRGDLYVFGGGASKLTVETSSGNLEIQ